MWRAAANHASGELPHRDEEEVGEAARQRLGRLRVHGGEDVSCARPQKCAASPWLAEPRWKQFPRAVEQLRAPVPRARRRAERGERGGARPPGEEKAVAVVRTSMLAAAQRRANRHADRPAAAFAAAASRSAAPSSLRPAAAIYTRGSPSHSGSISARTADLGARRFLTSQDHRALRTARRAERLVRQTNSAFLSRAHATPPRSVHTSRVRLATQKPRGAPPLANTITHHIARRAPTPDSSERCTAASTPARSRRTRTPRGSRTTRTRWALGTRASSTSGRRRARCSRRRTGRRRG